MVDVKRLLIMPILAIALLVVGCGGGASGPTKAEAHQQLMKSFQRLLHTLAVGGDPQLQTSDFVEAIKANREAGVGEHELKNNIESAEALFGPTAIEVGVPPCPRCISKLEEARSGTGWSR